MSLTSNSSPKEVRKAWVAALRSGQYQQCRAYLNDGTGYCCLGVLCELAVKAGVAEKWEGTTENSNNVTLDVTFYGEEYPELKQFNRRSEIYLPVQVQEWAGLNDSKGGYNTKHGGTYKDIYSLGQLNDVDAMSFDGIADLIESSPLELFKD